MSLNGKKILYLVDLLLALVYIYIIIEDVTDPGTWSKTSSHGDTDNSLRFIFLELFQVDLLAILLTAIPVRLDVVNRRNVFLPGVLALGLYAIANTIYIGYNLVTFEPQYIGITLIMVKMAIELFFMVGMLLSWLRRNDVART